MESSRDINTDIEFVEEDFKIIPECKQYSVVTVNGPGQKPIIVDIWSYACYFFANVQKKQISHNFKYIDGIRLDRFMELFCKEGGVSKLSNFIAELPRHNFQKEMRSRYDVHVNVFALYGLSLYVKEIISRRLCILFKPTAKDTIEILGEEENIKEIQISCSNGQTHITNSEQLREILWKSLQEFRESKSNEYEFDRVARCVDIFTKEYEKVEFVRMMSDFFHNYFSIKRRKNCFISAEEQRMLAFLLYIFDFTPAVVTESMIKKLLNSKINIAESMLNLHFLGMPQCNICVEFIPYSVWKNGRIDPFKYKPIAANSPTGKEQFTLKMGSDKERISEIIEIVKVIRDCFT